MNADRLLALYEKVAEAPDAVSRLRRFVLDLAVRGKLMAQDAGDEPASALLKRIAAEKARLVKAGEIRKPRDLANGEDLEPPFNIPASWRWCRLNTVGAIIGGGTPSAGDPENFAEPGDGVPWLTPADLGGYSDLFIESGARDLTEKGLASSSATMMPAGTVLFTSRAPIGYVAIAANPISTNQGFKSIVPYMADCSRFIALAMQTFAPEIDAKAPGTTFKEVSGKIVAGVPFPLPPLAEQRRIVARVAEFMALLDRLEAARTAREATRDRLTAASLARLTAPDTQASPGVSARTGTGFPSDDATKQNPDFPTHARFALVTLPALTTRPDQIKPLRQTILNLAVRGKLVKQNPADEPASELFARIQEWQRNAIAKKKIRKPRKPLASIANEDHPYTCPGGWAFVRLGEIVYIQSGDGLTAANMNDGPVPVFGGNGVNGHHDRCNVDKPTVVIGRVGYYCGSIHVTPPKAWVTDNAFITRFADSEIDLNYLVLLLNGTNLKEEENATAQPVISGSKVYPIVVGLPPLAEQHRIVAKVDALMALCDRLEAALTTTDTTRARLLEALLHETLDPAAEAMEAAE